MPRRCSSAAVTGLVAVDHQSNWPSRAWQYGNLFVRDGIYNGCDGITIFRSKRSYGLKGRAGGRPHAHLPTVAFTWPPEMTRPSARSARRFRFGATLCLI